MPAPCLCVCCLCPLYLDSQFLPHLISHLLSSLFPSNLLSPFLSFSLSFFSLCVVVLRCASLFVAFQALRHKVAEMARNIESCHAMLEQIAYQMKAGTHDQHMAGMIAITKVKRRDKQTNEGEGGTAGRWRIHSSLSSPLLPSSLSRFTLLRPSICVLARRLRSWVALHAFAAGRVRLWSDSIAKSESMPSEEDQRRSY